MPLVNPSQSQLGRVFIIVVATCMWESIVEDPEERGAITLSETTQGEWKAIVVPSPSSHQDPNRAPTEVAPSTPIPPDETAPSTKV